MRTGFVILSSDEGRLLEHSLRAALSEGFDDALVIDNASSDDTAAIARSSGVERLALARRVPYTEAMNAGLARMSADAIALLQADTFVASGYRSACVGALEDPLVGSVAPKLLRATGPGESDRLGQIDAAGMSIDRRRKNSLVGHGQPASTFGLSCEVFGADGAAAFYRRETLSDCAFGGHEVFDENMPGWGCDADLAWRARLLGWRSRYEPAAVVHHIRTYSPSTPRTDVRRRPPNPVPQPLPDDRQERLDARPAARRRPAAALRAARVGLFAAARARAADRVRRGCAPYARSVASTTRDPGPPEGRSRADRAGGELDDRSEPLAISWTRC